MTGIRPTNWQLGQKKTEIGGWKIGIRQQVLFPQAQSDPGDSDREPLAVSQSVKATRAGPTEFLPVHMQLFRMMICQYVDMLLKLVSRSRNPAVKDYRYR